MSTGDTDITAKQLHIRSEEALWPAPLMMLSSRGAVDTSPFGLECSLLAGIGNAAVGLRLGLVLWLGLALEQAGWWTSPYFASDREITASSPRASSNFIECGIECAAGDVLRLGR